MNAKLRRLAANLLKAGGSREQKGDFGERLAKEWFERKGITYYRFPQTPETMPISLARAGGKRPDFAVELSDSESLIYVDAKFHKTNGAKEFVLEELEISKFEAFMNWSKVELGDDGDRDVIFMVYPQELSGDRFVIVHLDELLSGERVSLHGLPARRVTLQDRSDAWFSQDGRVCAA